MATTNNNNKTKAELEKENSELANQLAEMKKMLEQLSNQRIVNENSTTNVYNNADDPYVSVISLCNNELNLSTEGYGHGEVYTFTRFGEEQNIPASDLKKIVKNNRSFTMNGLYYIADKDFIASEHLKKAYEKIADFEKLSDIMMSDKETFKNVFETIPDAQKEVVTDILVRKIVNGEDVDMNIVKVCGEIVNKDLNEIANSMKAVKDNK